MTSSHRTPVIAGNWKMYKTIPEALQFVKGLIPLLADVKAKVYLAVPYTALQPVSEEAKGSPIVVGAQNMNDATEGAFTGEIAGKMLKDAGAQFVILGHSERRRIFGETNAFIHRKLKKALSDGLQPIVCIGETAEERKEGKTEEVLKTQLIETLGDISTEQAASLILAYEPVWAIGSGQPATPEEAEAAHRFCREQIGEKWGPEAAERVIIQYGGSVRPEHAKQFMDQPDIDGLLVGGASLSLESFNQIIHSFQSLGT